MVVTGCLAERYQQELAKEIPETDVVLGIGANGEIAKAIEQALEGKKVAAFAPKCELALNGDRMLTTPPYLAYLKIAAVSYTHLDVYKRQGSRCISVLDVGGKNGNKLRRKRLPLQGILRNGSQRFSFRFPYPVYCNAGAVFHVENAGVIVSGNCRVQPPFGKRRPGWLPCRQIDRIRNVKKASAFRR